MTLPDRIVRRFLAAQEETLIHRVVARYLEAKGTSRGWEKRRENEERVLQNIPLEYHLAWKKLKNTFKGTPHEKLEQFLEYLEEHPGENDTWLAEHADKEHAKATREWEKKRKEEFKLEQDCNKNQKAYETALQKEEERAKKEHEKLEALRAKSEGACKACSTCGKNHDAPAPAHDEPREERWDDIPFA